jgi:hypothetical protein
MTTPALQLSGAVMLQGYSAPFNVVTMSTPSGWVYGVSITLLPQMLPWVVKSIFDMTWDVDIFTVGGSLFAMYTAPQIKLLPASMLTAFNGGNITSGLSISTVFQFNKLSSLGVIQSLVAVFPGPIAAAFTLGSDGSVKVGVSLAQVSLGPLLNFTNTQLVVAVSSKSSSSISGAPTKRSVSITGRSTIALDLGNNLIVELAASVSTQGDAVVFDLSSAGPFPEFLGLEAVTLRNIAGTLTLTAMCPFVQSVALKGDITLGSGASAVMSTLAINVQVVPKIGQDCKHGIMLVVQSLDVAIAQTTLQNILTSLVRINFRIVCVVMVQFAVGVLVVFLIIGVFVIFVSFLLFLCLCEREIYVLFHRCVRYRLITVRVIIRDVCVHAYSYPMHRPRLPGATLTPPPNLWGVCWLLHCRHCLCRFVLAS